MNGHAACIYNLTWTIECAYSCHHPFHLITTPSFSSLLPSPPISSSPHPLPTPSLSSPPSPLLLSPPFLPSPPLPSPSPLLPPLLSSFSTLLHPGTLKGLVLCLQWWRRRILLQVLRAMEPWLQPLLSEETWREWKRWVCSKLGTLLALILFMEQRRYRHNRYRAIIVGFIQTLPECAQPKWMMWKKRWVLYPMFAYSR